jgi:hypothetical protein
VHVARPPEAQDACPDEQLFVHVNEHAALGAVPEHVSGLWHIEVDAT